MKQFERTERLIGNAGIKKLQDMHVAVFGIGGVGGHACEALVRAGIGEITIIDSDVVDITNINRQIIALHSTVGKPKVEVMAERIADINPEAVVHPVKMLYLPENANDVDLAEFDYIIDAIDNVAGKTELIVRAQSRGIKIISSMGTGNKMDPSRFEIADISKTSVCPLARTMRHELKKRGIVHQKVLYSKEEPHKDGMRAPASISFVPSVAGLLMAGEVIRELLAD